MEDVIRSILPVREILLVATCCQDRFLLVICLSKHLPFWANLKILVCLHAGRTQVHLVRIDDLWLLFQIECFFIFCIHFTLVPLLEVFLIATQQTFWIRISYKFVGTTSLSSSAISTNIRIKQQSFCLLAASLWRRSLIIVAIPIKIMKSVILLTFYSTLYLLFLWYQICSLFYLY